MASSTAHHEPTHRSPSLTPWHPTLLSRPRHHRHHHHAQQHRTSLMRTAAATAAAAVCYPEMSPGKAIHIAGLTDGSGGPHQPNMVAVTARPLLLLAWLLIMSPSQHILALGTSEVRVLQRLQRAIQFRHPFAQRPCAAGQRAPNWRCAQRKDHETTLKNRVTLLVGDLLQAAGVQSARKHITSAKQRASKRWAPEQGWTWKHPRHRDIFAW